MPDILAVRRHIAVGANRTVFSPDSPTRLCRAGTYRAFLPAWRHVVAALFERQHCCFWNKGMTLHKPDCIRTEVSNLEILYQLLEQSEDLHHQWWSSSHDQATEILWFPAYSSIVHDVLEKNVSTNLDNIIQYEILEFHRRSYSSAMKLIHSKRLLIRRLVFQRNSLRNDS